MLLKELKITRQNLPRMKKSKHLPFCVKLIFELLDRVEPDARDEAIEMIRAAPWPPKKYTKTPKRKKKRG